MRWSEETSFRELKYTIGLVNWHSSKYDGILQELNARMILYNFCEFVTAQAVVRTRDNTKHIYKINFATAVNICRAYLKHSSDEIETMLLIQKHLTPVRSNRKYPIRHRPKGFHVSSGLNIITIILLFQTDLQSVFLVYEIVFYVLHR